MKTLKITLALIAMSFSLHAQAPWEAILTTQLENLKEVKTLEEVSTSLGTIERVAMSVNDNYIPKYYAAFWNIQKFWMSNMECEACVDKAEEFIKGAIEIEENAEIYALKGYLYQAKINLSPMAAPILSGKANGALDKAFGFDADNPRAVLIKAQMVYYTPKMFGGGLENAQPYFDKAEKLFADVTECDGLTPSWGKTRLDQVLNEIKSK